MLLIISFILILISSYFLTSLIDKENTQKGLIYLPVLMFAQIVLTAEVLSLFEQYKIIPVLLFNILFFLVTLGVWFKNGKPIWKIDINEWLKKIKNTLFLDKSLLVLLVAWLVFIASSVFLDIISPVISADAKCYHVLRAVYWAQNGSLAFFETADIRNLIFPINSEIVYSWIILFTHKTNFLCFLSFGGYILSILSLYNVIRYVLGFSLRKTLWVLFIISSFPGILSQASNTETDVLIAGFVLSSIYLFADSLKSKKITPLIISSLCYALAIGTKTTSAFFIPSAAVLMLYLSAKFKNYKYFLWFLGFGVINFILFSAYNYVQNFLYFGNPLGFAGSIVAHKNLHGIKGAVSTFIKHIFLLFDFAGFNWDRIFREDILYVRDAVLSFLHCKNVPEGTFNNPTTINHSLIDVYMGPGILGMIMLLPIWVYSLIIPIFKRNKKGIEIFIFGLMLLISILFLSVNLVYMVFSIRFINSFILICSPILLYSYIKSNKNPVKWIFILFACFYLTVVSTHLWSRPLNLIMSELFVKHKTIQNVRYNLDCKIITSSTKRTFREDEVCTIVSQIDRYFNDKNNKIVFFSDSSEYLLSYKMKQYDGYKYLDIKNLEDIDDIDMEKYNVYIMPKSRQWQTNFHKFDANNIKYHLKSEKFVPSELKIDNPDDKAVCLYMAVGNKIVSSENENLDKQPYSANCALTRKYYSQLNLIPVFYTKKYVISVNSKNLPRANRLK